MSKELDDFNAQIAKDVEHDKRKKEFLEKDLILKEHKVNLELTTLVKNQNELEQAKTVNFGSMSDEFIQQLVEENEDYMQAAKNAMMFINKGFKNTVPYFRKNLILIGGDTGDGKSTTVANVVFNTISSKDPATGASCRVLVLTNEEAPEDFYNRVTCLIKGWKYTNHDQFTDDQRQTFNEYIPILAKNGRLTIIGDYYQEIPGWTRTVEGIERIFTNLLKDQEEGRGCYNAIILDYYQNVMFSKNNPKLEPWECQAQLAAILDNFKMKYRAPIVVMAQMKKLVDEEDSTPFNVRLKGAKIICDKSTFICEIIPERTRLRSKWKVWKSRFTDSVGNEFYTGYDRGKFVPYSEDFIKSVASLVNQNLEREEEEKLGLGNITKLEDEIKVVDNNEGEYNGTET